jgi:ComF family protein
VKYTTKLFKRARDISDLLLELVFPKSPELKALEALSPNDFLHKVERCIGTDSPVVDAIFQYRTPFMREAIWQLKYHGNRKIAGLLAEQMYEEMITLTGDDFENMSGDSARQIFFLAIPLSVKRRKERGFNQGELLAQAIGKIDTANIFTFAPQLLEKIKDTPSQTSISDRRKRIKNVRGCFEVPEEMKSLVCGKTFILIDDVTTTGSTLEEARRALLSAGARKVICLAVAH